MSLLKIITEPWAITPDRLMEIIAIYQTHLRGEKIDIRPIEAAMGRPLNNQPQGYEVVNGVAIIPVDGVIAKRMNFFTQISGGISTELLARDFKAALADPSINAIIMNIDSPGGTVDGTADVARLIFEARGQKPIVAFTDGVVASAAYWIASAADKIYISNDTTRVGSIGVIASHRDISKAEEMRGVKTTEIYAGAYKRIATEYAPLTEVGKASIQEYVDYIYSVFVSVVAQHRGVSVEKVLCDMADGKTFSGKQAIDAGLVDGVSTLDRLIADLASGGVPVSMKAKSNRMEGSMADQQKAEATTAAITSEMLAEKHPDVFKAIQEQGYGKGVEAGAKAERERIQGVFSTNRAGREKLVAELMFDGKSTKSDAAEKILAAADLKRASMLSDIKADAEAVKVSAVDSAAAEAAASAVDQSLPVEERAKAEWDRNADIRGEFRDNYNAYLAFMKNTEAGRARIYNGKGGK